MKEFLKHLWELICSPYKEFKNKQRLKKRLEELRKRDPFIYK
jgi:hypothetical protein